MHKEAYPTQYDKMTKMPVSKLILLLGLPSTISMLITNIYNMVDTFFVGKLGTSASGAVGIVFGIMAILQAFGFLFGHGAGSQVARRLGAHDEKAANTAASISVFCSFSTGLLLTISGLLFLTPILHLMGSTKTILPFARAYALCIFIAAPFIMSSFTMNNILRYEGKANLGLIGMGAGAILNMILDPILMFQFDLGILGAGISTAFSQIVGFIILIALFQSPKTQCTFSIKEIRSLPQEIAGILYNGLPSLVRQGMNSISTMLLNGQAALYGDAAVAAMSIVNRIAFFIFAVGLGIGQGFQPVAGFNYGAGKYKRVKDGYGFTLLLGELSLGIFAILGMCVSGHVIGVFRDDPAVIAIGSTALFIQCAAIFFHPFSVCTNMLLQSTGKGGQASFTALLKSGLFFIPLILLLPHFLGILGIQIAQPIADVLTFFANIPFAIHFFKTLPKEKD